MTSSNNQKWRTLEAAYAKTKRNLLLLQEDHISGMQMQQNILPPSSLAIKGFNFAFYSKPALYMSGDFVDYFAVNDNFIAFYLADVAGHGASSAFITVLLKFMLIRNLHENKAKQDLAKYLPHEVLAYINRVLLQMNLNKHITMIAGIIDIKNNNLTYSIAGHLPLPIICINNNCTYLSGKGMPIGIFADAVYSSHTVDLSDNFNLALFSDGILNLIKGDNLRSKEANLPPIIAQTKGKLNNLITYFKLDKLNYMLDDITILNINNNK